MTLGWNVVGVVVLAIAAVRARSVALAGFGLDSLVEIGASTVVLWELSGRRSSSTACVAVDRIRVLCARALHRCAIHRRARDRLSPEAQPLGITWTALTTIVTFSLAAGKTRTGAALDNPVLQTEGRVTFIDGLLAASVLAGLTLNSVAGAWWADPLAGFVIVFYGLTEANEIFRNTKPADRGPYT